MYDLSFSDEFFFAEGEPYDRNDLALNSDGNPVSVWSALHHMPQDVWDHMCQDLFTNVSPSFAVPAEAVLDMIRETNTCSTLRSPVEVWIDPHGDHFVHVHSRD